jgi:hypothetical protein
VLHDQPRRYQLKTHPIDNRYRPPRACYPNQKSLNPMPTPLMKKAPEYLGALSLNNYAFKFKAIKFVDVPVLI